MNVLLFGKPGSGKSTLARGLADDYGLDHLDLNPIIWEPGKIAIQRSSGAVASLLETFGAARER